MPTQANFTFLDASNEKSTSSMTAVALTALNFDAQEALFASLQSAMLNLTIGVLNKTQRASVTEGSNTPPVDPYAQRELKWLVSYAGVTSGKIFQVEIATPDLTDNIVPGSDEALVTSSDWTAFITAFEAYVKSPDNGTEAVDFLNARLVGRNI